MTTGSFEYSDSFRERIVRLHRGMESWPNYEQYLSDHLGGPESRLRRSTQVLCPEIEHHCGGLMGKRVLDFGCGTGASTVALAERCEHVCAFDIDQESVDICRQRVREHGLEERVEFHQADDFEDIKDSLGNFDVVLMCGVVEHMPMTQSGLRKRLLRAAFDMLSSPGYLFIDETPNRLWPYDFHSTQLWWIPWTRPGSTWAYKRAVKKGRHTLVPTISDGPLGLEEVGAWGATYWEIAKYLRGTGFVCLNLVNGHNKHIHHMRSPAWKRTAFELVLYYAGVKLLRAPITAFAPFLTNLVLKKC